MKQYFQKNKKKFNVYNKNRYEHGKGFVNRYRKFVKCEVCGEKRWYLLEFHYNGDKEYDVSMMVSKRLSIKRIKEEIRKCQVLCCNCHREWHFLNK